MAGVADHLALRFCHIRATLTEPNKNPPPRQRGGSGEGVEPAKNPKQADPSVAGFRALGKGGFSAGSHKNMSLSATAKVISHCPEKGAEYAVLLALADRAQPDGSRIWYSLDRLAFEIRLCQSTTRKAVASLIKKGRLGIERKAGPRRQDVLQINFPETEYTLDQWRIDSKQWCGRDDVSSEKVADFTTKCTPKMAESAKNTAQKVADSAKSKNALKSGLDDVRHDKKSAFDAEIHLAESATENATFPALGADKTPPERPLSTEHLTEKRQENTPAESAQETLGLSSPPPHKAGRLVKDKRNPTPPSPPAPRDDVRPARAPDLMFEAFMAEFRYESSDLTKESRGMLNRSVASLKAAGYQPEDVAEIAKYLRLRFNSTQFVTVMGISRYAAEWRASKRTTITTTEFVRKAMI